MDTDDPNTRRTLPRAALGAAPGAAPGPAPGPAPRARRGTASLRKALRLLSQLAAAGPGGLRLTDLVGRADLDPATAHRMLACLVEEGFLQKQPSKRYQLGHRMFELGLAAGQALTEHVHAHGALHRLSATVGAAATLIVRSGGETVYLDRVEGPECLAGLRAAIGTRLPIGIGAGGVALLAAMDQVEADALVRANAARYRVYGRDAPKILRRSIEDAKREGFAVTRSFLRPDVGALGVVVPGGGFVPPLAISIVGSAARLSSPEHLVSELRLAADEVHASIRSTLGGPFFNGAPGFGAAGLPGQPGG